MSDYQLLEKLIEKVDTKLDNITKEINEFKSGIQANIINLTNRVDVSEVKIKNVENHLNRSFKDRLLDMILNGVVYSISCCIGLSIFFMILKGVGGNILTIIKPILSAFTGI